MSWFKKRKEDVIVQPPSSSRVEVELHKSAGREALEKAKEANEHLNTLLVENGFTLKIYLAAGGNQPKSKKSSGKNK